MNTENEKAVRDFDDWFASAAVNSDGDELLDRESAMRAWQAALQSQVSNTDGWVRVPVEPTSEMQSAIIESVLEDADSVSAWAVYKAMLAAAPKAPQQQEQSGAAVWQAARELANDIADSFKGKRQHGRAAGAMRVVHAINERLNSSPATPIATASQESAPSVAESVERFKAAMANCSEQELEQARDIFCEALGLQRISAPGQEAVYQFRPEGGNWIDCSDVFYDEWKGEKRIVYLAPPTSTAIAAMAFKQAAEIASKKQKFAEDILGSDDIGESESDAWKAEAFTCKTIAREILALTPANAEAELEALMMKVGRMINGCNEYEPISEDHIHALVRRVLDEMKGE